MNAAPAVAALVGAILEIEGVGLGVTISKFAELEVPPLGAGFDT